MNQVTSRKRWEVRGMVGILFADFQVGWSETIGDAPCVHYKQRDTFCCGIFATPETYGYTVHPWSFTARPWKTVVGRLHSYWEGNFSGAMLNFCWVRFEPTYLTCIIFQLDDSIHSPIYTAYIYIIYPRVLFNHPLFLDWNHWSWNHWKNMEKSGKD